MEIKSFNLHWERAEGKELILFYGNKILAWITPINETQCSITYKDGKTTKGNSLNYAKDQAVRQALQELNSKVKRYA